MASKLDPQFDVRKLLSAHYSELLPVAGVLALIAYLLSA